MTAPLCPLVREVSENSLSTAACTPVETAGITDADTDLVLVVHPFHPLAGRRGRCVGVRPNGHVAAVLLEIDGSTWRVPRQWTDLVSPDPVRVMGEGRALFGVEDLMKLLNLIDSLARKDGPHHPKCM